MGKGNIARKHDPIYIDYEKFNFYDEEPENWVYKENVENIQHLFKKRYPSFNYFKGFQPFEDYQVILENQTTYLCVADNEYSLAIFLIQKDEHEHLTVNLKHYKKGLEKILLDIYNEIKKPSSAWTSYTITGDKSDLGR